MIEVALFEPEIAGNVGNIIRTCMCFNASLSIIGYIPFQINDKNLKRAGMDYAIGFPVKFYKSIEEFDIDHQDSDVIYITRYGEKNYSKFDLDARGRKICLMFGRESTGIPKEVLKKHLDKCARIPMVEDARSLNLSNSVAIVLSETQRQSEYEGLSEVETLKGAEFLKNWENPYK